MDRRPQRRVVTVRTHGAAQGFVGDDLDSERTDRLTRTSPAMTAPPERGAGRSVGPVVWALSRDQSDAREARPVAARHDQARQANVHESPRVASSHGAQGIPTCAS
jgi:hypothetical protein